MKQSPNAVDPEANALPFGLSQEVRELILNVIKGHSNIDGVLIFGSRAKGNFKNSSDIDLAIIAPKMTDRHFAQLWGQFDELPLAFKLDVLHFDRLESNGLRGNILRDGVAFA